MSRPGVVFLVFFIMARMLFAGSTLCLADPVTRPNILFILVDDLGWGDVGCQGGVGVATPNIDSLARDGLRFTQYYAASPICSPSRVGLITGQYPQRWRIHSYLNTRKGNAGVHSADWLDPKAPSLARILREAGYATAHFGKWHLGGGRDVDDAPLPSAYGFDESLVNGTPLEGMGPATPAGTPRWKTTGLFIDRTLDFARRRKGLGKPFFINLWLSETHDAHVPRPEDAALAVTGEKHDTAKNKQVNTFAKFQRTLIGLDRDLGRLLDGLREQGLERDTLVIFTGDNGPQPLYDRARVGGLRGQKWSLYEGGVRQPLLVRWPARVPAGQVNETTVLHAIDMLPTLSALAGAQFEGATDGEDLSTVLIGGTKPRARPMFWQYGAPGGPYLKPAALNDQSPPLAIRDGRWKLLIDQDGSGAELYDLVLDPRESKNLVAANRDVAKRLTDKVLAWRDTLP